MRIPLVRPSITNRELKAIQRVLKSEWLVEGRERDAFEKEFARFIGAKYIIATDGATSAMFLGLKALGIEKRDEVILPALTFAAAIDVVLHCGATPVLADVLPYPQMTLDPDDVSRKRTEKTKAVIPMHMAGQFASRDYDLPVVEDSAHLIEKNCMGKNSMAFSFHATKVMTTGRGGAIATNDANIAAWLRQARNFGISTDAVFRDKTGEWKYDIAFPGWSHQMTDIEASLGRVQLKRLPTLLKKRRRILDQYNLLLHENNTGLYVYPILVPRRDAFVVWMRRHGIQTNVHFTPLHHMSAFKAFATDLPVTDHLAPHLVSLPFSPDLNIADVNRVAKFVMNWRKNVLPR